MEKLEGIFYEALPYTYAAIAALALYFAGEHKMVELASAVLGLCSFLVIQKRRSYRASEATQKIGRF